MQSVELNTYRSRVGDYTNFVLNSEESAIVQQVQYAINGELQTAQNHLTAQRSLLYQKKIEAAAVESEEREVEKQEALVNEQNELLDAACRLSRQVEVLATAILSNENTIHRLNELLIPQRAAKEAKEHNYTIWSLATGAISGVSALGGTGFLLSHLHFGVIAVGTASPLGIVGACVAGTAVFGYFSKRFHSKKQEALSIKAPELSPDYTLADPSSPTRIPVKPKTWVALQDSLNQCCDSDRANALTLKFRKIIAENQKKQDEYRDLRKSSIEILNALRTEGIAIGKFLKDETFLKLLDDSFQNMPDFQETLLTDKKKSKN